MNIFDSWETQEAERLQCALLCVKQCPQEFLESLQPRPKSLTLFGIRYLTDVIKLRCNHFGGLQSNMTDVFKKKKIQVKTKTHRENILWPEKQQLD